MAEDGSDSDPAYGQLQARGLQLLLGDLADDDRAAIQKFLLKLEERSVGASEARAVLRAIVSEGQALVPAAGKTGWWEQAIAALQSPPFYFFFGCLLLALAFVTSQIGLNTSLTFLVAMLGVAILLYGTGSQAAGTFGDSPDLAAHLLKQGDRSEAPPPQPGKEGETPKPPTSEAASRATPKQLSPGTANLVIAGGAAVLTAFFGWGVITYQNEIRQVFRDHDQYTKVRLEFCDNAVSACADPDALDNVSLATPEPGRSALRDDTLWLIRQAAYLETGLGERAYGKVDDNGLEFVVFERDLGRSGTIKLLGASAMQGSSMYSADVSYFSFRANPDGGEQNDRCLVRASQDSCLFILTVTDSIDADRVPRVVIRAVLSEQSLIVASEDPVVPQ